MWDRKPTQAHRCRAHTAGLHDSRQHTAARPPPACDTLLPLSLTPPCCPNRGAQVEWAHVIIGRDEKVYMSVAAVAGAVTAFSLLVWVGPAALAVNTAAATEEFTLRVAAVVRARFPQLPADELQPVTEPGPMGTVLALVGGMLGESVASISYSVTVPTGDQVQYCCRQAGGHVYRHCSFRVGDRHHASLLTCVPPVLPLCLVPPGSSLNNANTPGPPRAPVPPHTTSTSKRTHIAGLLMAPGVRYGRLLQAFLEPPCWALGLSPSTPDKLVVQAGFALQLLLLPLWVPSMADVLRLPAASLPLLRGTLMLLAGLLQARAMPALLQVCACCWCAYIFAAHNTHYAVAPATLARAASGAEAPHQTVFGACGQRARSSHALLLCPRLVCLCPCYCVPALSARVSLPVQAFMYSTPLHAHIATRNPAASAELTAKSVKRVAQVTLSQTSKVAVQLLVVPALITSSALGYLLMSFASPLAASSPYAQAWDKQPSALCMSVAGFVGWWSCAVYMFWASVGTLLARLHSAALAS